MPEPDQPIHLRRPKVYTSLRDQAFGPHLGEVVARGIERAPLATEMRGTGTTWPQLAASLGEPAHRAGLRLALDPERLATIQREIRREHALSRLDSFGRWITRHEEGTPLFEPQNIVKFVLYVHTSLADLLTTDELAEFAQAVQRARALGVEIP